MGVEDLRGPPINLSLDLERAIWSFEKIALRSENSDRRFAFAKNQHGVGIDCLL